MLSHNRHSCQFLTPQVTVDPVMTDTVKVVSQIRHGVVDGTAQEILAVIKFSEAHSSSLGAVSSSSLLPLRKSC